MKVEHKLSIVWFLDKSKLDVIHHAFQDIWYCEISVIIGHGNTILSSVWCMVYARYIVQQGWVVIECKEYSCNWYCDMLTLSASKHGAGTDAEEYTLCYPSWWAQMCYDDCSNVCDTKYHMYGTCECRSPMDCRYKPMKVP